MTTIINNLPNRYILAFENCFNPSVRKIAYPTTNAAALGLPFSVLPKEDALHFACNVNVGSDFCHSYSSFRLSLINIAMD
jgi:hypothetical protein